MGEFDVWFLYFVEGIDELSCVEFDIFVGNDLFVGEVVIVYGIGLI